MFGKLVPVPSGAVIPEREVNPQITITQAHEIGTVVL